MLSITELWPFVAVYVNYWLDKGLDRERWNSLVDDLEERYGQEELGVLTRFDIAGDGEQ
jgi:hypothetical protein